MDELLDVIKSVLVDADSELSAYAASRPLDKEIARQVAGRCRTAYEKHLVDLRQQLEQQQQSEVEVAWNELRTLFPDTWFELSISHNPGTRPPSDDWYRIKVYGKPHQGYGIATVSQAMAAVKKWKEESK